MPAKSNCLFELFAASNDLCNERKKVADERESVVKSTGQVTKVVGKIAGQRIRKLGNMCMFYECST